MSVKRSLNVRSYPVYRHYPPPPRKNLPVFPEGGGTSVHRLVRSLIENYTRISQHFPPIFWPVRNSAWPSKNFGSLYFSEKLPTHPSPKPALTLTSQLGQSVGLGGGVGGQFPRNVHVCGHRFRLSSENHLKPCIVVLLKRAKPHLKNLKELRHEM